MPNRTKRPSGHPAKQDPEVAKLSKAMKMTMELVRDLGPRLTEEQHLNLRAGALGLMWTYSNVTGLKDPTEFVGE